MDKKAMDMPGYGLFVPGVDVEGNPALESMKVQ